jgi:hypothetical protein
MLLRDEIRYNHAGSHWLTASSGSLGHNTSCLLIAHVTALRNSRSNPEKELCERVDFTLLSTAILAVHRLGIAAYPAIAYGKRSPRLACSRFFKMRCDRAEERGTVCRNWCTRSFDCPLVTCYSPMIIVQPCGPIHTSCFLPASTSTRAPGPNFSFVGVSSCGYVIISSPFRMRCVVNPA